MTDLHLAGAGAESLQLARQLAVYLPATLVRRVLADGLPPIAEPRWFDAAVLFADISGFTPMVEELATDGPRGAEELSRVLLQLFTAMIDLIHTTGGAVNHFHGDAMLIYFPDEDGRAAERALACAREMQGQMLVRFAQARTTRPPGKDPVFPLTMKIGAGYGRCLEMIVGSEDTSLEFVLAGDGVEEATAAENQANPRQIIASRTILQSSGRPAARPFEQFDGGPALPPPRPLLEWTGCTEGDCRRLIELAAAFMPDYLYRRIVAGEADSLADHRPATSMFVQFDGIDYNALEMGDRLQEYYQWAMRIVARYTSGNGRVNRITTGDKGNQLHLIFGAPVAPDAPEQALRCALAMQRERPSFITGQKIGVAAGKVFASPVGSESRREFSIVGDIVNLSARLCGVCPNGAVMTNDLTAGRASRWITFELLPPVRVKGKAEPVSIFQAVGERPGQRQLESYFVRRQRPLIGRETSLQTLKEQMDAALDGHGSVVALTGPVGAGKTQLLTAGVRHWLDRAGTGFVGVCQPHTTDVPYHPWQSIWHEFFGLTPSMSAEAQATAVVAQTYNLAPDVGDDAGLWAEILGLPVPQTEIVAGLAASVRQARFFALARRLLDAAASRQPLLLTFEDIHWADQLSLELIDALTDWLPERPLLVVVTLRQADEPALLALSQPHCATISLTDFSPSQARAYVQQRLGVSRLPSELEAALTLREEEDVARRINPLFLDEQLKAMLSTRAIQLVDDGRGRAHVRIDEARLPEMILPDTIHSMMLARLDQLPDPSRDLLQVAAVMGEPFGLSMLAGIAPQMGREAVVARLAELEAAEIAQQIAVDPEPTYLFRHAMTRQAAYESLPFAQRQALHARAAGYLEDRHADNLRPFFPALAYHYGRTDLYDKGLRYALAAGHDALALYANREAVQLYTIAERHLRLLGDEADWETAVELYLARSRALRLLGNFNKGMEDAELARRLAGEHGDIGRVIGAYNVLIEYQYLQARYDNVLETADELLSELGGQAPPHTLTRIRQWAGMAASMRDQYDRAADHLAAAERASLAAGDEELLARVLNAMAHNYFLQYKLAPALEAMQRGVRLSRAYSTPANIGGGLNNIAVLQLMLGRPEDALATEEEAIALTRDMSRNLVARFIAFRANILAYLGRYEEARASFDEATELLVGMDDDYGLIETYLLWGFEYCCPLGDWEEAAAHFQRAEQLINRHPESYPIKQMRLWVGRGQVALAAGALERAGGWLEQAAARADERKMDWQQPAIGLLRGQLRRFEGALSEARRLLDRGLAATADRGNPDYRPLLLLELSHLAKTSAQRHQLLAESVTAARRRARASDRRRCYRAGTELVGSPDPHQQQLGAFCVRYLEERSATP